MISIIIPVYNAENGLKRMLDSILAQTYTDYECLLIDDGSTDASGEICREYEKADRRFHCISQENQGVSAARNHGMELSKGEYIAFLDADDQIPPHYLKTLFDCCQSGDIAVCDVAIMEGTREISRFTREDGILTQTQGLNALLTRKFINSGPCAKLFRREVISNLRFPAMRTYEDILFVCDVFSNANQIVVTNRTQYNYIQNAAGTMSRMQEMPSLDVITATEKLLRLIAQRADLQSECCYVTVSHLLQYAMPLLTSRNYRRCGFIDETRRLYHRYMSMILSCRAIPWKEKATFYLFSHGWALKGGKKLYRMRKETI